VGSAPIRCVAVASVSNSAGSGERAYVGRECRSQRRGRMPLRDVLKLLLDFDSHTTRMLRRTWWRLWRRGSPRSSKDVICGPRNVDIATPLWSLLTLRARHPTAQSGGAPLPHPPGPTSCNSAALKLAGVYRNGRADWLDSECGVRELKRLDLPALTSMNVSQGAEKVGC